MSLPLLHLTVPGLPQPQGSSLIVRAAQAKLWDAPPIEAYGAENLFVRMMPKAVIDDLIRSGHYSGSTCWASYLHLGVVLDGKLIGGLQFGPLMNPGSAGRIVRGATADTSSELNRMWLQDEKPPNVTTRALKYALKILRSQRPRVEWVQSFADERCGKWGGVYQAASFLYLGTHTSEFLSLDGEWFHKSAVNRRDARGWGTGPKIARLAARLDVATRHSFRQFRYFKPLTRRARANLLLAVLPYPKPHHD